LIVLLRLPQPPWPPDENVTERPTIPGDDPRQGVGRGRCEREQLAFIRVSSLEGPARDRSASPLRRPTVLAVLADRGEVGFDCLDDTTGGIVELSRCRADERIDDALLVPEHQALRLDLSR